MATFQYLRLEEMAGYEGISPKALAKRFERHPVATLKDPDDSRRKLYSVSGLTPRGYQAWMKAETCTALENVTGQSIVRAAEPAKSPQAVLAFAVPSQTESALLDAVPPAIPERFRPYIEKWSQIIGDCTNGTWRRYRGERLAGVLIEGRSAFIRAQAKLYGKGFGVATIYSNLGILKEVNHTPAVPPSQKMAAFWSRILPENRPGRSGHSFFCDPENAWMREKLLSFYLTQAKHSVKQAHQLLLEEIDGKQRVWGAEHIYQRPTLAQCRTALQYVDSPTLTFAREGQKAFDDKCGKYISRDASTLRANDLWVTDQREVDVRKRDGGEHLGRVWMVTFIDVASDKVLGYSFGPILSSDVVMMAATMAISRFGVPRAVHMDLGKEFICQAFNGKVRKFSGEVLYREAQGLWNSLGVEIVKAIGRNPKTKTIERWHREVARFDRRFPGYCGSKTSERPEKLAEEERQHLDWLAGKAKRTPLITITQYIRAFIQWAEVEWNGGARGCGKMRQGMTPNEAWNVKSPAEGIRTISSDELDRHSADHRFVKIARGGQVNLSFFGQKLEYEAPELFLHQDKEAEVIISRRTFRQVTVIYPVTGGTASCVATLKPQLAWLPENRDELRAAMRCKAAVHRAIRLGVKASQAALDAANPVELLEQQKALPAREIIGAQKFFAEPSAKPELPRGYPEIGSVEYMARRRRTASDAASRFMEEDKDKDS